MTDDKLYFKTHKGAEGYNKRQTKSIGFNDRLIFLPKSKYNPTNKYAVHNTSSGRKGWVGESTRHSMASYGIKTGTKSQFTPKKVGKKYMLIDNNTKQFLIGYSFDSKKEAESFPEVKKDVAFLKEKKDIVHHFDEFTTSDLQGTVEALAKQYGVDEDELLNEIIVAQHYKTKKLQDEYLDSKEFAKGSAVRKKEMEVFNHG